MEGVRGLCGVKEKGAWMQRGGTFMTKVGIIGCGGIAKVHAWVLQGRKDIKLAAFCDIDLKKAESMAKEYAYGAEPLVTKDWLTLCEADLDAVHICTPHDLHAPMAIELLKHGKVVFMEKPCAISMEQFEKLKEADARHPGRLGFCFQNRYNETTLLLDELTSKGEIGKVLGGRAFVTWRRDEDYYLGSTWKGKLKTEGGGALINQSIHTLDLLLRYLGAPKEVKGSVASHHFHDSSIEVEDTIEAWMQFSEGRRAVFYASNGYVDDAPVILELQGEKGRIYVNGSEVTVFAVNEAPKHFLCEKAQGIGKGYWGCGHKACIEEFYEKLLSGEPFQNNLAGVQNTFQTMMHVYEAAREG